MTHLIDSKEGRAPMLRCDLCQDKGQAFVELALVLPIFILLMVGVAEVGRLAYASIEVSNAARAGVAYAAQSQTTAADINNIKNAAKADAPEIASLTATPSYSCSCESSTGTITAFANCSNTVTNLTTCPSPSRIVVDVQITTTAHVDT